jgi:ATP-dependent helicase/nuclease subunit B
MLLGKSGGNGDALLPSRLLLAARGAELARRVKELFRDVEPPDAGMSWVADWKWRLPEVPVKARLSVTALRDFLACPLRFFLKHGVGMYGREGERVEWNARDFGNVIHLVLERWGRDAEAREFSKTEALEEWLFDELVRVVTERHGASPPLAVRIQMDGARQRLGWFARQQACLRAEGWRVREVERKYVIDVDGVELVGKVDRIDEHEDGRVRVVDYKTYQEKKDVEKDHRLEMRANTRLPEHLENVDAVLCRNSKGKPARWTNLQVPLYASFLGSVDELGYLVLGATEGETGLSLWPDFDTDDRDAAMSCARWIIAQVKAGNFGPADERVQYDDFEVLAMGRPLGEMMERSADA